MSDDYDVFLAYRGHNLERAHGIRDRLAARGRRVFLAGRDIELGDEWADRIQAAIAQSRVIGFLLDRRSAPAKGSAYLRHEIDLAIDLHRERGTPIVPIWLDGVPARQKDHPYGLGPFQAVDARDLDDDGVADALHARLGGEPASPSSRASGAVSTPAETRGRLERLWPALFTLLVRIGLLAPPHELGPLHDYLRSVRADLLEQADRGGYVGLGAANVAGSPAGKPEYGLRPDRARAVRQVRQAVRLLAGTARGGDQASAQLASLGARGHVVRSVVGVLLRAGEPIVLLGEPGSGKSVTLRKVALDLAERGLRSASPAVPVIVRLGEYRGRQGDGPGDVMELVVATLRAKHPAIANRVGELAAAGRLVVLFDGMDEMERGLYPERVAALSRFAAQEAGRIKTVFACRINDFSPEFVHRRMALLPFGPHQVIEYVRSYFGAAVPFEGASVAPRALARTLLENELIGELVTNPLLLFLVCHHVDLERRLPRSRAELFQTYVRALLGRLAEHGAAVDESRLLQGWARLAFDITRGSGGVLSDPARVRERWAAEEGQLLLHAGSACGLLQKAIDGSDAFYFSHHRLQEYFTALHLKSSPEELDWASLLDSPRWQETLVHLAALGGWHPAMEALMTSLTSGDVDEARLADRVVLAALVAREGLAEAEAVVPIVREAVKRLAAGGTPSSQVKMLWACKSLPDLPLSDVLAAPLASDVEWVREQALLLLCETDPARRAEATDLAKELVFDFARGTLLRRLPAYFRAARKLRSRRERLVPILGALSCILVGSGVLAAVGGAAGAWAASRWTAVKPGWLIAGVIAGALLNLLPAVALWRSRPRFLGRWFVLTSALSVGVAATVGAIGNKSWPSAWMEGFSALWVVLIPGLAAVYVGHLVALATLVLAGRLLLCRTRYAGVWRTAVDANVLLRPSMITVYGCTIAVYAGFLVWRLVAPATMPTDWSVVPDWWRGPSAEGAGPDWFENTVATWGPQMVGVLLAGLVLFGVFWRKKRNWRAGCQWLFAGPFTVLVFLAGGYLYWSPSASSGGGVMLKSIGFSFALLLGCALGGYLLHQTIDRVLYRRQLRRRVPSLGPAGWLTAMRECDRHEQFLILGMTSPSVLGLGAKELQSLLTSVEREIKGDPAASQYWRLRGDLEQILRQEQNVVEP